LPSSTALVPNLIKVRSGRSGRCTYDKEAKRELVRRCLEPGVSLARTALEHGVSHRVQELNWAAIVTAAVCSFILGGPWYSKQVSGAFWVRAADQTKPPGSGHPARVFGLSFAFALIAAAAFAYWLGPHPTLSFALGRGLLAGSCFVATSFGINYQFANRSPLLWLINGGYHTLQFVIFGLVVATALKRPLSSGAIQPLGLAIGMFTVFGILVKGAAGNILFLP
jgi:hypothetical protein